jgi:hypothetical protein
MATTNDQRQALLSERLPRIGWRTRIVVPDRGIGDRLNQRQQWLDQNAGADGWAITPSGGRVS